MNFLEWKRVIVDFVSRYEVVEVDDERYIGRFWVLFVMRSGAVVILEFSTELDSTVAPFILHVAEFELLISAG